MSSETALLYIVPMALIVITGFFTGLKSGIIKKSSLRLYKLIERYKRRR